MRNSKSNDTSRNRAEYKSDVLRHDRMQHFFSHLDKNCFTFILKSDQQGSTQMKASFFSNNGSNLIKSSLNLVSRNDTIQVKSLLK